MWILGFEAGGDVGRLMGGDVVVFVSVCLSVCLFLFYSLVCGISFVVYLRAYGCMWCNRVIMETCV